MKETVQSRNQYSENIGKKILQKHSLAEYQLLKKSESGTTFGFVQCNAEVPKRMKTNFAEHSQVLINILVSRKFDGYLMRKYAEEKGFMSQTQKKPISRFYLQTGSLVLPQLFFYSKLGP